MTKIAILKKDSNGHGGLEKATWRIIQALKEHEADVTLLTASNATASCPVLSCSLQSWFKFQKLKEFDVWCLKKSKEFDIVFSMDRSSYQTHHRAGNGVHAAYLDIRRPHESYLKALSFSLNPLHRVILQLEKATFEDPRMRGIIVNSSFVKDQILHYYSTPPEKIHVIHNGVEWQEMEADFHASFIEKQTLAKSVNLDPEVFQFLFVGHNFERKGLSLLLQALSRLKRQDFHLSVVGTDKHLSNYKKQAAELRLSSRVTFFYTQRDTRPFYQIADALVIPSIYDPFANVTVEALAMGLFVISSKTNGGYEVLTPHSGMTFDSLESLTHALETAMNRPKTALTAQSIRASVQHLDFTHQLKKVCKICLS